MKLVACRGGDALAVGDRHAGDPDDFFLVANERQRVTAMSRNMGVDQDVLEAFCLLEPEWAHSVAWLAAGDYQWQLDEVGIDMTDLVAGPETRRIAAAGFDGQPCRWSGRRGGGRRLPASERFDLEEAGVGNEAADDPALQRRGQTGKRGPVMDNGVGEGGNLRIEKAVFFTEDVGGAGGGFGMWRVLRRAGGTEVIAPHRGRRRHEIAIVPTVGAPAVVEMGDSEM